MSDQTNDDKVKLACTLMTKAFDTILEGQGGDEEPNVSLNAAVLCYVSMCKRFGIEKIKACAVLQQAWSAVDVVPVDKLPTGLKYTAREGHTGLVITDGDSDKLN